MSQYRVLTHDTRLVAEVGYNSEYPGYWIDVWQGEGLEPVRHAGSEGELPTLVHLLKASRDVVLWSYEITTLKKLIHDTWIEELDETVPDELRDLLISAFSTGVPA